METLTKLTASQAIGLAHHVNDDAEASARYVNTGQQGAASTGARASPCFFRGQRLSRGRLRTCSIKEIVQLGLGAPYTAHSLRVSFMTIAKPNGANDDQTTHTTTAIIRRYTHLDNLRQRNATQKLGL